MHERVQIAAQLVHGEEAEVREAAVQQMLLPRRKELEELFQQQVGKFRSADRGRRFPVGQVS